jgi:transcriptional regulator with GAF, ATPase, and Fis domain
VPILELKRSIVQVAPADAIHAGSRRRDRPCVKVNCAALPPELLVSELFGHERGAFTGATERRQGLLAAAHGGTLFLDEVGDLSPWAQAMLLRFLQGREVRPVGSTTTVQVDVRLITATNRDLKGAVDRGEFRADLLDRLGEVILAVPALRDRRTDVLLLAEHFLSLQARRHGLSVEGVSASALAVLAGHAWPGNVRELEQALSRAVIRAARRWILPEDLGLPSAAMRATGPPSPEAIPLTSRQLMALKLAIECGTVSRRE